MCVGRADPDCARVLRVERQKSLCYNSTETESHITPQADGRLAELTSLGATYGFHWLAVNHRKIKIERCDQAVTMRLERPLGT